MANVEHNVGGGLKTKILGWSGATFVQNASKTSVQAWSSGQLPYHASV